MFGDEQSNKKTNPVGKFYDWVNYKANIDGKKFLENKIKTETNAKEIESLKKQMKDLELCGFERRDKDSKSVEKHTPTQFILLSQTSCIKGWDSQHKGKIYSNEVISLRDEVLKVCSFTKESKQINNLWEGNYSKDVSNEIQDIGGKFTRGLIVLEGTDLNEYYLQGASLKQYSEDVSNINTNEYKVKLDGFEEKTTGSITYFVPVWKQGDKITDEEASVAMEMVRLLKEYRE